MHSKKRPSAVPAIILIVLLMILAPLAATAQQANSGNKPTSAAPTSATEVVPLAPSSKLVSLLPDALSGLRATTELKQVGRDNLSELVADKATFYREYLVTSAVSREYGRVRVDVFETQHPSLWRCSPHVVV